jgi:hypothetical protein
MVMRARIFAILAHAPLVLLAAFAHAGDEPSAPSSTAETERNKAVVRAFSEQMSQGDIPAALANFADEVDNHGRRVGKPILRIILEDIQRTFPDGKTEIVELVAEGDTVVARCMVSGTHKAPGSFRSTEA